MRFLDYLALVEQWSLGDVECSLDYALQQSNRAGRFHYKADTPLPRRMLDAEG